MNVDQFLDQFESLKIPLPGVRLPTFVVEERYKKKWKVKSDISNFDFLRALCLDGFSKLKFKKDSKEYNEYSERVKKELAIINELGFTDYILLVWDVINFCIENSIPTGLGRGSAAGSLVLFLIGVTKIDPIKYGLYFERFISKTRAKKQVVKGITYLDGSLMCDVDMDICYYKRQKVLEYIEEKFKGRTSKILTFNTLSAKLLIKELGKIVGNKPEDEMTHVSSLIPKNHGMVEDIEVAYAEVEEFKEWCDENRKVYDIALKLKDLIKNKGVHPSGVLISYDSLVDTCPTELSKDKEGVTWSVSSYNMDYVALFTVKLDILGLRGVSVVDDVAKALGINILDVDLTDPQIYLPLQDLKYPHGLFQIEADLAFRYTQKIKPRNLSELSGVLAIARPGALQFVDKFALFTNTGTVDAIHPFFEDILHDTGGVAIYQEQLMQMSHKIGFTLDEAEILRRIVGKKKVEEVKEWKSKIEAKVNENKLDHDISGILWRILEDSASYSFNKSHSISYAALCALTIYFKFKYPTQFFLSLLKMAKHEPNPIEEFSKINKEMVHFGIKLLPPSLATSKMDFMIEGKDIRFGLSSIKGISDKTIEKLNNFKREHANKFELFLAGKEAGLSIGIISALIQAGTLDKFGNNRSLIVYEAQLWNKLTDKEKEAAMKLALKKNDFRLAHVVLALNKDIKDEKGKVIIKDSRLNTIKKHTEPYKAIYFQNKTSEAFANWWYEKTLLGYATSTTLLNIWKDKAPDLLNINDISELRDGQSCMFVGQVDEGPKMRKSRGKGTKYAQYMITDETGTFKVMLFHEDRIENCKQLNGKMPKEKAIVIVKGTKKDGGAIFADVIAVQPNQVYTKLADLKDKKEKKEKDIMSDRQLPLPAAPPEEQESQTSCSEKE